MPSEPRINLWEFNIHHTSTYMYVKLMSIAPSYATSQFVANGVESADLSRNSVHTSFEGEKRIHLYRAIDAVSPLNVTTMAAVGRLQYARRRAQHSNVSVRFVQERDRERDSKRNIIKYVRFFPTSHGRSHQT